MKPLLRHPRSFLLLAVCWSALARTASAEPALPANLAAPADQVLALTLTARGVQIYECRPVPNEPGKSEWAFKAPEADLFDAQDRKVGRHYAGPTWELTGENDGGGGSKVVGRVKAKADAPDGKGIPWLLLEAAQTSGDGVLGRVQSIQRVDTAGGQAPTDEKADSAKAGQERRVAYSATYRFYTAKP